MNKQAALLVIIVLAVGYLVYSSKNKTDTIVPEVQQNIVETTSNTPGDSVTIPRVVLSEPGFIMIHESDLGRTGTIVMTGEYLPAGESTNIIVDGITTKSGEKYFAMLHVDDGNGSYDNPSLDPPAYSNGKIIQKEFEIE